MTDYGVIELVEKLRDFTDGHDRSFFFRGIVGFLTVEDSNDDRFVAVEGT